jgi:hypothetical protein
MARYRDKVDQQDDSTECLRVTADDEINQNMADVDMTTSTLRPKNNNDQYRINIIKFRALCHLKYAGEGDTTVTPEKAHKFIFYQAHRQNRKRMKGEERTIDHDGSKAEKGIVRSLECLERTLLNL